MLQETIDQSVVRLFAKVLETNSMGIAVEGCSKQNPNARFILKKYEGSSLLRTSRYATVDFYALLDKYDGVSYPYAVKKNKGLNQDDERMITKIEATLLNSLEAMLGSGISPPVAKLYGYDGNLLLLKFIDGKNLEEHLADKQNRITFGNMLGLLDSMVEIDMALTRIVRMRENTRLRRYLANRKYRQVATAFSIDKRDLARNFYTYRIAQAGGIYHPEASSLLKIYAGTNHMLSKAKKTWISFDHPKNRIVLRFGGPFNTSRYDFNHVVPEYIGLDLAMQLGAMRSEHADTKTVYMCSNLAHLLVLGMYRRSLESRVYWKRRYDIDKLRETENQIRHDGAGELIPVDQYYDDKRLLKEFATMYAAFLHRNILDIFRSQREYNSTSEERYEQAVEEGLEINRMIASEAAEFKRRIGNKRSDYLANKGYVLMTDTTPLDAIIGPALKRLN